MRVAFVAKRTTRVCMTCLAALCLPAWGGDRETTADVNETTTFAPDNPADDNEAPASHATRLWRNLTLSHGITRHHYREPDPFGRVDPLDSETGWIPTTQATLRWNVKLAQALPEIAVQAHASYAQGQTDYNGYLQQGITLTPYRARTGNTLKAYSLRMGLPLNAFTQQTWAQHVAPYAEQSWHHWQRNLVQYGETFTWQTTSFGVMALWPLADLAVPAFSRFALEADWAVGHTRGAKIAAPALDFFAGMGSARTDSAAIALYYDASRSWFIGLRYETQRMSFGASPTIDGLQYPGSSSNEQTWAVSLGHRF